jgi:2-C-methyl-D-erythritol 4-phosphate cytidylyltransferase
MAATGPRTVAAILVAGGNGSRLGRAVPKSFVIVGSQTLLEHAAARFLAHSEVRDVVVVAPYELVEAAAALLPEAKVVPGGVMRQDSVARGLAALAPDVELVLVHDVARPFVPAEVISRVIHALRSGAQAVVPVLPLPDSVRSTGADDLLGMPVDRADLVAVQTPQGFARGVLVAGHARAADSDATDDAVLAEAVGATVISVPGAREAFKITYPFDLVTAEWLAGSEAKR